MRWTARSHLKLALLAPMLIASDLGGEVLVVVLLGMVAGFLALRLYAVLGKRTGHEQPLARPAEERVGVPPVIGMV